MADNYRALTRTYRPHSFDDIVSQGHVSDTLKNAIKQNRLAHAYMFCGPRGVGKTTMARVLARTVNGIEEGVDGESLNQTLNVIEIDAASNNGVDDIRDLRERVRIPPQNGRYKIYIIDEVHMLSKAAFNALLKTLEEPPDHVIFIFATTEPHKVLPTILSRVQRFDFKRISVDEIVSRLRNVSQREGINIDDESLHVIAKKADGALRDALGLLDQAIAFCGDDIEHEELLHALNVVSTERLFQFMSAVENHNASDGLELINDLLQEGYDIQEFLVSLTEHLRNLYVAKNSEKMYLVEATPETKDRYRRTSKAFTEDDLMRMLHIVSEAQYKIKEAHQPRIQFEITLLKLIHMERTRKLNELMSELEDLKKKLSNGQLIRESNASDTPKSTDQATEGKKEALASGSEDTGAESNFDNGTGRPSEEQTDSHDSGTDDEAVSEPESQAEPEAESAESEEPESRAESENQQSRSDGGETAQRSAKNGYGVDFFGEPSLRGRQSSSSANGHEANGHSSRHLSQPVTETATATAEADGESQEDREDKPRNVSLAEVKEMWPEYIEALREHVPQMLYFQMQRVEPIVLKNRELKLRCNDDFSKKIVEENKKRLAKVLEEKVGVFLRLKCTVQKTEEDAEESKSPYERFKALQERDPKIKTLVELFGAELDYNLNR